MRSDSIPRCLPSPAIIGSSRVLSRLPGATKKAVSSALHIREAFFIARKFTDLDDLNAQAEQWCRSEAADRPCPEDREMTVRQAFAKEQPLLLPLPANPYPVEEQVAVKVGKTPYVRFDLNDYTVPHPHVRRMLSVRADLSQVRIFDGAQMIASHRRSYDRGQEIEDRRHLKDLSLTRAVPVCQTLMIRAAEGGANIGALTTALLRLLDRYGATELQAAVEDALRAGSVHAATVRAALERRRLERGEPPPVETSLPKHVRRKDTTVRPHRLDSYDQLAPSGDNDDEH